LTSYEKAKHISKCLELAILFEVSANKPGNVNLVVGFEGTRHEHFLASAVAAAPHFEQAAMRGIEVSKGKILLKELGLGQIIKNCVKDVNAWQHGGNTLLGTIILLSPIAIAAGMILEEERNLYEIPELRKNLKLVVKSTTSEDAINVYEVIKIVSPSGLGEAPSLDINDPDSTKRILKENVTLFNTFQIASQYDNVCSEWVKGYPITFDIAYPYLREKLRETEELDVAIIHTFLKVLAEYPDTFIARKVGTEEACRVSSMADEILKLGGFKTPNGRQNLFAFDHELRKAGNLLNPGTTADIIAAALSLVILEGYRP
jgi:triphosphoribosyl-dephospho-CoA synthase